MHREALDQALRQALGTSQAALRRQALERAAAHLIHPRLILETPLLTEDHVWHREALAVSDAFEAVTNGMEEPGVLDALDALEPDSPFQAWRHLILALHFFYEGLDEGVRAHVSLISASSPVAALARVLETLLGDRSAEGPVQRRLTDLVSQPDPLTLATVQDVAEGLETGDEGLFLGALADWLEAVSATHPEKAKAALLWAWNQLEWREFSEVALLETAASLWGRCEAYRLAALGTAAWDPEGAALLWLRFLVSALREAALPAQQWPEARRLLDSFRSAALASDPTPEGDSAWAALVHVWNTEVRLHGRESLSVTDDGPQRPLPLPRSSADGQLDLFSA